MFGAAELGVMSAEGRFLPLEVSRATAAKGREADRGRPSVGTSRPLPAKESYARAGSSR